jgi:hypothetical protein
LETLERAPSIARRVLAMMNNQQPSQQKVFEEHLPYEIIRLIQQYLLLLHRNEYRSGLKPDVEEAVHDGLLVGFCTHARNLLEFFFHDPGHRDHAAATDYAAPGYVRLDRKRPDVDRLYKQLCAQINHLTYNRTDDDKKKIGPLEWKELIEIILSEATRLAPQLKSGYDNQHLHIDRLTEAAAKIEAKGLKPIAARPEAKGLKPITEQPFFQTEPAGTTSVATDNVGVTFSILLKSK